MKNVTTHSWSHFRSVVSHGRFGGSVSSRFGGNT